MMVGMLPCVPVEDAGSHGSIWEVQAMAMQATQYQSVSSEQMLGMPFNVSGRDIRLAAEISCPI